MHVAGGRRQGHTARNNQGQTLHEVILSSPSTYSSLSQCTCLSPSLSLQRLYTDIYASIFVFVSIFYFHFWLWLHPLSMSLPPCLVFVFFSVSVFTSVSVTLCFIYVCLCTKLKLCACVRGSADLPCSKRMFSYFRGQPSVEYSPGSDLSFLLTAAQ